MSKKANFTFLLFFILCFQAFSQADLGEVTFKPEGMEVSQPYFNKGLLLLHSFEYEDAIEQFQMAQMLDPNFVMAYWGEAMCYYYPLWNSQDYEMGKGTLMKLGIFEDDRLALAKNELEKGLLKSVEELYKEMETEGKRVESFNNTIEQLHEAFPNEMEVSAFFALSMISQAKLNQDATLFKTASATCQKILESNPAHPGALNYLIYANEDPNRAKQILSSANKYASVAPNSEHALHAGSHTFVSLGLWNESVMANVKAWEATDNRVVSEKLSLDDRNYHSYWWLQYGYLQQGRFEKAASMVQDMYLDARMSDSKFTRYHLLTMKAAYVVNSEDWNSKASETEVPTRGLNITTKIGDLVVKGLKAYHTNDINRLKWVSGQITDMLSIERNKVATTQSEIFKYCGSDLMRSESLPSDIQLSEIMELEMLSLVAMVENNPDKAFELLSKACDMEKNSFFNAGPPVLIKPSFELYGEILLQQSKLDEAVDLFNQSLERCPNRTLSLRGKYHALKNSGKTTEAAKVKTAILNNWKLADAAVKSSL